MENVRELVVDSNDFKASNVYYAKPKVNPSGGKNVSVMDSSIKKPLMLQTPLMLTWGINEWTSEENGKKTYDLSLQFPREEDDNYEKCKNFLKSLQDLEQKLLEDALTNSKEWFGKKYDLAPVVEALFTPMLRYPKDQNGDPDYNRQPSFRVKVPYWDGKFNCELYDLDGSMLFPDAIHDTLSPVSLVTKGQKIATIVKCGGIWFANGKFGVTWKLIQGVVQSRMTLRGKCHIKLDTKERVTLDKANMQSQYDDEDEDNTVVTTQVEDSDDDGETASVQVKAQEPEQTPPTPPSLEQAVASSSDPEPEKRKAVKRVVKKASNKN
jgi:hypothetical protein